MKRFLISIFAITNLHIFGRQFPLFLLMVSLLNHFLFAQMYFTLDLDTSSPIEGFPHISVGKESACNTGDPSFIPGSGRSTGEGVCYPIQYSWASMVAQLVRNPPAMWETWI